MNITSYTYEELKKEADRLATEKIQRAIKWKIAADGIEEKSPEWYTLMSIKTYIEQPHA